jgi:hypothetical protein
MKTLYYCVTAEFYDTREAKVCLTERLGNVKPKNVFRKEYGITAFKIWTPNKDFAEKLLEAVKTGEVYIDDLISYYHTCHITLKSEAKENENGQ